MSKKRKPKGSWRDNLDKHIFLIIIACHIVTIIFLTVQIITYKEEEAALGGRTLPEYYLMIAQCVIGLVLIFLPSIAEKHFTFTIPSRYYLIYVVFLYCAIYLGEVWHFFYKFKYWDVMLHSFSGIALGGLGFSVVFYLNKDPHVRMSLSPFFVALFAFCFAVALGAIWEICEFTIDGVFGVNMQKFALQDGTQFVGREALSDTMEDLIIDSICALISSVLGYFAMRHDRDSTAAEKKKSDD